MPKIRNFKWWKHIRLFLLVALVVLTIIVCMFTDIDWKKDNGDLVTFGIAVLAFLITLDQTFLAPYCSKPRLGIDSNVDVQTSQPDQGEKNSGDKPSDFFRLRIFNKGLTPARNCLGRLIEIQDTDKKSTGDRIRLVDPINLYWARQNENNSFEPIDIQGEGDFVYLDIVQIREGDPDFTMRIVIPNGQRLPINEEQYPQYPKLSEGNLPIKKTYFLRIGIYAENAYVSPTWFTLSWDENNEPKLEQGKKRKDFHG